MKFTTDLFFTVCLAGSALAAPRSRLADRIQARATQRQSHPLQPAQASDQYKGLADVQYSSNWAGVARLQAPPEGPYSSVTGTFIVPSVEAAGNSNGTQAASAWVGIDGDTANEAILQTGVDFYIENGQTTFQAWYEWFPANANNFDIAVNAGDVIVATVKANSVSKGTVTIENKSTGKTVTTTISAPKSSAHLVGQNAEWIVEDFQSGDTMVQLLDFGTITFTDTVAFAGSATYGVDGAAIIDLKQNNVVLTEVSIEGDDEVIIQYIG